MKNLKCPQCEIERFFVKNALNENLLVNINELLQVIPVHMGASIAGFDLTVIYCLGCSWFGSPTSLKRGRHK